MDNSFLNNDIINNYQKNIDFNQIISINEMKKFLNISSECKIDDKYIYILYLIFINAKKDNSLLNITFENLFWNIFNKIIQDKILLFESLKENNQIENNKNINNVNQKIENNNLSIQESIFLEYLNNILKINNKNLITKIEDFKNIEKNEIIKIEKDPNFDEFTKKLANHFDKKKIHYYYKNIKKNYSFNLIKNICEILQYDFNIITKRKFIKGITTYYYYLNINKKNPTQNI